MPALAESAAAKVRSTTMNWIAAMVRSSVTSFAFEGVWAAQGRDRLRQRASSALRPSVRAHRDETTHLVR